ncbi:SH3 domain-containing protein [Pseudanabaena sp. UWO311]|uniref:SH3 domain-containing protein n=1 Tax=Pseudanabaena sp. UWO311 TaxID=2487337 RepID=UPI00115B1104|nr:SH3 domain-containing protein [Pseudanabaena sp. UWO311]TYQ25413.1 SH3 domain-containing protein [Pseudanabaena sp. UWO311]
MIKSLGIALILGFSSISCLPALASTKTNLELPKSETVINEDIDNNGKPDRIVASYFIRPVLVPKYDSNACQTLSGKFVRYTLYADGQQTGKVILEQSYGTSLASYWIHKLTLDKDLDGDGRKELLFYMGDDTSQESMYLFVKPDGVKTVYLGVTDLPGASLNENFDLQFFRGEVVAQWNRAEQLWKSKNRRFVWTLGNCVEIRERPDARSNIVSMMSKHEVLTVFQSQTDNGWIGVEFPYGKKGWIKKNNISFTSPARMIRFAKP